MPNWCENSVSIWAENEKDIQEFKKKAFKTDKDGAEVFQFNNLIPMPEEIKDTTALSDTPNWYDWANENWGTKWDVEAMVSNEDIDSIEIEFETAWCPPQPVYDYIRTNFPDLTISWFFHEPGMEMAGYLE